MSRRLSLIVLAIAACGRDAGLRTCDDSIAGVWSHDHERWMMLDNGATLEAYPMFDDATGSGEVVSAPRVIDLKRHDGQLDGAVMRRTMHRGDVCEARAPIHVTACHDHVLELGAGDADSPLGFAPCTWQPPAPPHVERWQRE